MLLLLLHIVYNNIYIYLFYYIILILYYTSIILQYINIILYQYYIILILYYIIFEYIYMYVCMYVQRRFDVWFSKGVCNVTVSHCCFTPHFCRLSAGSSAPGTVHVIVWWQLSYDRRGRISRAKFLSDSVGGESARGPICLCKMRL